MSKPTPHKRTVRRLQSARVHQPEAKVETKAKTVQDNKKQSTHAKSKPKPKPTKTTKPKKKKTRQPNTQATQRYNSATPSDWFAVAVLGIGVSLAACSGVRLGQLPNTTRSAPPTTVAAATTTPSATVEMQQVQPPPKPELNMQFLDVGHGDAILIRSPEGNTMLIDGGNDESRLKQYLTNFNISKIDIMVISHDDGHHITALPAVLPMQPSYVIHNGLAALSRPYANTLRSLKEAGSNIQKANNQRFKLGSVSIKIIAPPFEKSDDHKLNNVGVLVEFGKFRALMTGDSPKAQTNAWMLQNRRELKGPFHVYKSAEHGGQAGDHDEWLALLRPRNVVISLGENYRINGVGQDSNYPSKRNLRAYGDLGAKVYRTDQQGTIGFRATKDGRYKVVTNR